MEATTPSSRPVGQHPVSPSPDTLGVGVEEIVHPRQGAEVDAEKEKASGVEGIAEESQQPCLCPVETLELIREALFPHLPLSVPCPPATLANKQKISPPPLAVCAHTLRV